MVIGSGRSLAVLDVVEAVRRITGAEFDVQHDNKPIDHPMAQLLSRSADFIGEARCPGRLYLVKHYPGMVLSDATDDVVFGAPADDGGGADGRARAGGRAHRAPGAVHGR